MTDRRQLLEEAFSTIERLEERLEAERRARHEPLAIVGVGLRYPGGAEDLESYWSVLRDGVDATSDVPPDRWDGDLFYDPSGNGFKMSTRRGGFLRSRLEGFEPALFGMSPREAATLDPQQRLLLETAYEALESAGIAPDRLNTSATGVFVGITTSDYFHLMRDAGVERTEIYASTGTALNSASGRLSFTWGLQGPCVSVDTACSSSLVATHLACQSLRAGDSDLALAGGVNVILIPEPQILFTKWGMMAKDGRCKTFDARADGFVRAEGAAVIALKRLSDARAAGDRIFAVIRGSAVNSDGRSSGLTVPSGPAQVAVILKALENAGLGHEAIDYSEAHGTGTPIGDPIEVEALGEVIRRSAPRDRPLLLGAAKTNIGHAEAASGMAGLLKVVASLQHEAIPPSLHFDTPNPRIAWSDLPIKVPTALTPWPRGARPRRAGVSAFGFSGTNAHLILEEAPPPEPREEGPALLELVPLSAREERGLRAVCRRTADALAADPAATVAGVARTAGSGRAHMGRRLAIVAGTREELERDLRTAADGQLPAGASEGTVRAGDRPKVAFLFTGQGAQYAGMGRALYEQEPVFRASLDRSAGFLAGRLERPLLEVLWPAEGAPALLSQTGYTQPALFALEVALAELWRSWGITPSLVMGHSVGEYAAACVAGVFSVEDGLALIAERGRLMQALPPGGAMAAIFATEARVAERLARHAGRLSIAAINGPEETVISGEGPAVAEVVASFTAEGVQGKPLDVSHAFHSHRLDPMLDGLERFAAKVPHAAPHVLLVSNLSGAPFPQGAHPDAAYWRRHAREPVRFAAGVEALRASGVNALVEIGPHPTLLGLASRAAPGASWASVPSLRRGRDERRELLSALGALYVRGAAVDWDAVMKPRPGRRAPLPTYPFQREEYWSAPKPSVPAWVSGGGAPATAAGGHPLLGRRQPSPLPGAQFLAEVTRTSPATLGDHVVLGNVLLPGTGYLEMALAAARELGGGPAAVEDFAIEQPFDLGEGKAYLVHLAAEPEAAGRSAFVVRSAPKDGAESLSWRTHAKGVIARGGARPAGAGAPALAEARARCTDPVDVAAFYGRLSAAGLAYGPSFRAIRSAHAGDREAVGRLEVTLPQGDDAGRWVLHPALLDAAFQLLGVALSAGPAGALDRVHLPVGLEALRVSGPVPLAVNAVVRVREAAPAASVLQADLRLEDDAGHEVAAIEGLQLRATDLETLRRTLAMQGITARAYALRWERLGAAEGNADLAGQRFLLVQDGAGVADALAEALGARGARTKALPASSLETLSDDALAAELGEEQGAPLAWVVDASAVDPVDPGDPRGAARAGYLRLLRLSRALVAAGSGAGLCVVTRGASAIAPGDDPVLARAPVLGLARTVAAERGGPPALRVDLDPSAPPDVRPILTGLAGLYASEPELGVRQGALHAPRLRELSAAHAAGAPVRQVLRFKQYGDLDALDLVREKLEPPAAGQVQIDIRAAGLNFRDVLNTLGMVPGAAPVLGAECSGVVSAVGAGVTRFKVGDEVVALAIDSMATHLNAAEQLVVPKPAGLSHATAVMVPNAYLTAAVSLLEVARIKPGQKVLVHAAAGGVGLSALRLAKRAGAEVIATAGSPEKRAMVLRMGASHAFDSRSASFADDVLRVTGGAGVDCVLNSLAGELIAASARVVKQGGCFVEIGKQGVWTVEEAAKRAPGVRYVIVDLGTELARDPAPIFARFEQLLRELASGELEPLPVRAYDLADAKAAFRTMAAGKHVGKLVLVPARPAGEAPPIREDGTYLVTGGLGGLGLASAEWLARHGAGHLVLAGRKGPGPGQAAALDALRALGAEVTAVACDVSDPEAVKALWRDVLPGKPPLRGILHTAGVVADGTLADQDAARFDVVAPPKIDGALNLHAASARDPIDLFVLYSSTSGTFGSPGQANYAAANAFLDGLAASRRARGLAATSVAWGAWGEVGMAARVSDAHHARWAKLGLGLLSPADAFPRLERALAGGAPQVAIVSLDAGAFTAQAGAAARALFGARAPAPVQAAAAPAATSGPGPLAALRAATGPAERRALLRPYVHEEAARVLGFNPSALDQDTPLSSLGFDSLMAVQLRNRVESDLALKLPLAELLSGPTVAQLTESIGGRLDTHVAPAENAVGGQGFEEGSL